MCAGGPCSATDSGHKSPSPITRSSLPLSGTGQASLQWSRFYPRAIRPRKVEFSPSYTPVGGSAGPRTLQLSVVKLALPSQLPLSDPSAVQRANDSEFGFGACVSCWLQRANGWAGPSCWTTYHFSREIYNGIREKPFVAIRQCLAPA